MITRKLRIENSSVCKKSSEKEILDAISGIKGFELMEFEGQEVDVYCYHASFEEATIYTIIPKRCYVVIEGDGVIEEIITLQITCMQDMHDGELDAPVEA